MQNEDLQSKVSKSAKKTKSVIDANLIFAFDRKVDSLVGSETAHSTHTNRPSKSKIRHYESSLKSIFFQSNFKFLLYPDVNPAEKALSDPDTLPPWDSVLAVVQTLGESDSVPTCPICMETAKIPQFTKCGHVFCWTCMLQQLHSTYSTAQNCSVCTERVHRRDLRPAHFLAVSHPIEGRSHPMQLVCLTTGSLFPRLPVPVGQTGGESSRNGSQAALGKSSSYSRSESNPAINSAGPNSSNGSSGPPPFTNSTSCSSGGGGMHNRMDVPYLHSPHAKLSRVLFTTTEQAAMLLRAERSKLIRFHDSCLATATSATTATVPTTGAISGGNTCAQSLLATASDVSLRPSAIPAKSVWGSKPASAPAAPDTGTPAAPKPSARNRSGGDLTSSSCAAASKAAPVGLLSSSLSKQKLMFETLSSYDVEYLPYVTEALWLLDEATAAHKLADSMINAEPLLGSDSPIFAKKVSDLLEVLPTNVSPPTEGGVSPPTDTALSPAKVTAKGSLSTRFGGKTSNSNSGHSETIEVEASENMYYFFQSESGEPVFLHPLCMKCLFTSAYLDAIGAPMGSLPPAAALSGRSRPPSRAGSRASSRHPSLTDIDLLQYYIGAPAEYGISPPSPSAMPYSSAATTAAVGSVSIDSGVAQSNPNPLVSHRRGRSGSWTGLDGGVAAHQSAATPRKHGGALSPVVTPADTSTLHSSTVNAPGCSSPVAQLDAVSAALFSDKPLSFQTMLSELKKLNIRSVTLPSTLSSKIKEVETAPLTAAMKTKIPFLRHFPDGCSITLVEVQMKSIVREDALARYESDFSKRAVDRRARTRAKEIQKHEEKLERIVERDQIEAAKESLQLQAAIERSLLEDLHRGPRLGRSAQDDSDDLLLALSLSASLAAVGEQASSGAGTAPGNVDSQISTTPSFKTVMQMGGHFPTLSSSPTGPPSVLVSPVPTAASAAASKWAAGGLSGKQVVSGGTAWPLPGVPSAFSISSVPISTHIAASLGKKVTPASPHASQGVPTSAFAPVNTNSSTREPQKGGSESEINPQSSGRKKTKKAVPLFTNASGRSYR